MDSYGASSSSSDLPGRIRKRRYSTARIQPTRIKKVMQSDEEIGRMIASVPVAIGSAMEHFAEKLLENAQDIMHQRASKTLAPAHVFAAISRTKYLKFLEPIASNFGGGIATATSSSSPVTTPTNGLLSRPFENISAFVPPVEEKFDLSALMRDTAKAHLAANTAAAAAAASTFDDGKRRRGRPKKDEKEKPKAVINLLPSLNGQEPSFTVSSSFAAVNGNSSSTAEMDRLLMPPPPLLPLRKPHMSKPILISNSTSTSSSSTPQQSATTMVSKDQKTADAISA